MITTELGRRIRDTIGVTEDWNVDAPHFRNRGVEVDAWNRLASAPLGSSWCASWAGAMWAAQGFPLPVGYAACEALHVWAGKTGTLVHSPLVDAIVLYDFTAQLGVAHHCGIVLATYDDGMFLVAEGNTSGAPFDPEGFGVFVKERSLSSLGRMLLGFVRPPTASTP
jgi:hypothetical protein